MVQILGFNRPQNRAPQGRVFIDRDNWQANGLVFCAPLTGACLDPTDVSPRQIGVLAASGSAGYTIDGEMGPCATLNGSDQYFEGANPPSVTLPFSIMFWGKRGSGASGYGAFIGNNTTSSEMVGLGGYVSPTFGCTLYHRSSSFTVLQTTTITVGAWHHYCGVVTSAELFAYLDASTQATHTGDAPYALPSGINRVTIGRLSDSSPGGYWPGEIRDVRIYDRVVSEAEIYALQEPPEKFALFCEPGVRKFIFLDPEVATSEATAVVAAATAAAQDATAEKPIHETGVVAAATASASDAAADQNIHATALVSAATAAGGDATAEKPIHKTAVVSTATSAAPDATCANDTSATALVAAGAATAVAANPYRPVGTASGTATANDATAGSVLEATALTASATAAANAAACEVFEITVSRSTGLAPLSVYFETDLSSGFAGTTHPFHEIHYVWDFGDPTVETWEFSGKNKNVAFGPVTAHLFESAGTCTATCNAYLYDDEGSLVDSWSASTEVTTTDTWGSTYVISDTGDFTGAPSGTQITSSDFASVISTYCAPDVRILLRPGGTWTVGSSQRIDSNGPGYIGPWGAGTAPHINATASVDMLVGDYGIDWRIEGLHFDGNGQSGCRGYACTTTSQQEGNQITIVGCEFELLDTGISTYSFEMEDFAVYECTSTTPLDSSFYSAGGRCVFMGNDSNDQDYNNNGHCFRLYGGADVEGGVVSHNRLGGNVTGHHAIKCHGYVQPNGSGRQSRVVISDNNLLRGDIWALDVGPMSDAYDEHVMDVIIERNQLAGDIACACKGGTEVTIRNNIFNVSGRTDHTCIGISIRASETHDLENVWVYNNTAYNSDSSSDFTFCEIDDYSDCVVVNNLASSPNDSSPVMIDDNGTDTTATNNLLTNTPGWVESSPSDPEDFKLDPDDVSKLSIDTGTYTHWSPGTFGGGNRITAPSAGTSFDLGAWEIGADLDPSAFHAAGTASANDATAELAVGFERTALVASGAAAAGDASAVVDDFERTATAASASASAQDATAAKDISAAALVAAGTAAAADATAEKALTAAALVATANAAANEVTWEKDTSALAVAAAATAAALDASSPSSVADVVATEDYHLLPPRPPTYPGLGDFTILRNFPKRRDHGYG